MAEITAVHSFWRRFLSASAPVAQTRESANREFRLRLDLLTLPSESMWSTDRAANMFRRRYPHNKFLRDHRTGEVHHFDPRLFDLLSDLTASVGRPGAEINIICGFRTPWSNEFLRHH